MADYPLWSLEREGRSVSYSPVNRKSGDGIPDADRETMDDDFRRFRNLHELVGVFRERWSPQVNILAGELAGAAKRKTRLSKPR